MRKIFYMVGTNGYETRCNTLESAMAQVESDYRFRIRQCFEDVEEPRKPMSPIRLAWLKAHTK